MAYAYYEDKYAEYAHKSAKYEILYMQNRKLPSFSIQNMQKNKPLLQKAEYRQVLILHFMHTYALPTLLMEGGGRLRRGDLATQRD